MKTVLKLIRMKDGLLLCDDRHYHGGICTRQIALFQHLCGPSLSTYDDEELLALAQAHDWEVRVTELGNLSDRDRGDILSRRNLATT